MRRKRRLDTNQSNENFAASSVSHIHNQQCFGNGFWNSSFYNHCGSYFEPDLHYDSSHIRQPAWRIRQVSNLLRFAAVWMMTVWHHEVAAASSNGTVGVRQKEGERFYSSCPFEKLDGCFRRAFTAMSDPNEAMANCQDYERLAACFRYVNCSEKESSEIGARVFFMVKRVRLPKEFFSALITRWRLRCSLECTDYEPEECRKTMLPREQDADYALLMELQSLKMQMTLLAGSASQKETCTNYRRAMYRWHIYRLDKCSNGDSTCYCRREERRLRPICNVQCDKLHLAANSGFIASLSSSSVFLLLYAFLVGRLHC